MARYARAINPRGKKTDSVIYSSDREIKVSIISISGFEETGLEVLNKPLNLSRRIRGKIRAPEKTKLTSTPRDHTLSALLLIKTFSYTIIWQKYTIVFNARATTAQLYPGRDTFEFDQEHVTKNQPITVLVFLSKSLRI